MFELGQEALGAVETCPGIHTSHAVGLPPPCRRPWRFSPGDRRHSCPECRQDFASPCFVLELQHFLRLSTAERVQRQYFVCLV